MEKKKKEKKNKTVPDVFVILFALILISAALTWIIPVGSFEQADKVVNPRTGKTMKVVVPGTFQYNRYFDKDGVAQTEKSIAQEFAADPLSGLKMLAADERGLLRIAQTAMAPLNGFEYFAKIIVFIFIVGGAFFVLGESGAIAAGTHLLVKALRGKEFLIIPIIMVIFSFFGAAFGMCEEAMPFALVFVPLALALGYDSLVGVCLSFVSAGVGFATGFMNPFTVGLAQGICDLQIGSGWEYRVVVWAIATLFTIAWVMIYAARVKKDPKKSPMYEEDQKRREALHLEEQTTTAFTWRHGVCLAILFLAVAGMIAGVQLLGFDIPQIGGLFFGMGIATGVVSGMKPSQLAKTFVAGVKDMVSVGLVVGFAGGVFVTLRDGHILDTILYGLAAFTSSVPKVIAADAMYGVQMVLNVFIPSGSSKAMLTMPLFGPLADLSGITRQTAVLAYQLGAGLTSMIIPTSGVTMGTLAMAKVPYEKWFRWHLPMQIAFVILALGSLVWPVLTSWE